MNCPICAQESKGRPAKRFCPAKGEAICSICCGRGREATIDCPSDCPHLVAAHRYDSERAKAPLGEKELPYPDVQFPLEFVYERWGIATGIAGAILRFQAANRGLHDADALAALASLAETYRTLDAGILYDHRPAGILAAGLYGEIGEFLGAYRKRAAEETGFSNAFKDGDLFRIFVFLLRLGRSESGERPLSRAFLGYLRDRVPAPAGADREEQRIIVP
ncbi:MAG TPA: hypothetical protein VN661_13475 [Candidatus Acidoferrales bacterium]|nr:hypothetical protein [Candidatus Acidoferrales bacterium]